MRGTGIDTTHWLGPGSWSMLLHEHCCFSVWPQPFSLIWETNEINNLISDSIEDLPCRPPMYIVETPEGDQHACASKCLTLIPDKMPGESSLWMVHWVIQQFYRSMVFCCVLRIACWVVTVAALSNFCHEGFWQIQSWDLHLKLQFSSSLLQTVHCPLEMFCNSVGSVLWYLDRRLFCSEFSSTAEGVMRTECV